MNVHLSRSHRMVSCTHSRPMGGVCLIGDRVGDMDMLKGFRNFLMRGDVIVVAVGLVVALAFSNLVKAFTDAVINPLIAADQGGVKGPGLGWQLVNGGGDATYLNIGGFISAIIYFVIFMGVV